MQAIGREVILTTEEETVGIDTPHIIIYSNLADTSLQLRPVNDKG